MIVAVAMSGGIDSLVAAALLKDQGHEVFGVHFITGYSILQPEIIRQCANQLSIEIHFVDCKDEFQNRVIKYFVSSYYECKTPNPCMVCNPNIKFDTVFKSAKKLGADAYATGHYARLFKSETGNHLLKAKDVTKDQSYFLALMKQEQFDNILFPLGNLSKNNVREIAKQKGISPAVLSESQEICFIPNNDYKAFVEKTSGLISKPGDIKTVQGKSLGKHQGLHCFTVGQRKGINCPAQNPYYVIKLDKATNTLIVGQKQEAYSNICEVSQINRIQPWLSDQFNVRVRYRHTEKPAIVTSTGLNTVTVKFLEPQLAITPGQGAVFYSNDEIVGGGWIT